MANQTNTGSGSIVQGEGSIAAGERSIAAGSNLSDSTVVTGDNNDIVGRDKNIYYITVVGHLLDWARVEGILPQIKSHDFSSIAEAVEGALNTRLKEDLVKATVFAGEILSDFVDEWLVKYSGKPIPLAQLVTSLVIYVGYKLRENGYWEAYTELYEDEVYQHKEFMPLYATTMLYRKTTTIAFVFGIVGTYNRHSKDDGTYQLARAIWGLSKRQYQIFSPKEYDSKVLRIIIAGIVLDLIRLYSENTISVQFLQELSGLFKLR